MKNILTQKSVFTAIVALCLAIGIGLLTSTVLLASTDQARSTIQDGSIIRAYQDDTLYITKIIGNKLFKRPILAGKMFEAYPHLKNTDILIVYKETLDTFKTSTLIMEVNPDGTPATGNVYYLSIHPEYGTVRKHHLNITAQQFEQVGFDWDSIYHVNHAEGSKEFYIKGPDVTAHDLGLTLQPSQTTTVTEPDRPYVTVPIEETVPYIDVPAPGALVNTPVETTVPYIDVPIPFINTDVLDAPAEKVEEKTNTPAQIATPPRPGTETDQDGTITRVPRITVAPTNAVYYTSNHPTAAYYYPEDCSLRNTIPAVYQERFSSLSQLFEEYSRTLHPHCI